LLQNSAGRCASGLAREIKMNITSKCLFFVFPIFLVLLGFVSACEPQAIITFKNEQNQDIKIFVASVRDDGSIDGFVQQGIILAHTEKKLYIIFLGDNWINRIEARNPMGEVVFSGDYNRGDLDKVNWRITILP
jgi:hypothetical protein